MSDSNYSYIDWDADKLDRFKAEYNKHSGETASSFSFEGHEFLVGYAKYLIQYLEEALCQR